MTSPIPAAIYARYSTDRQDDRSLEDQERLCRRVASSRIPAEGARYKILDVVSDAGTSGATLERPGLRRLLEACRRGIFQTVSSTISRGSLATSPTSSTCAGSSPAGASS